ncbi:MAG: hypothetical protein L6R37_006538 [Teloschistes peruensis]|nr:MAG: hypothetical protein L6R37_006538 [Teloschistes peruensis]
MAPQSTLLKLAEDIHSKTYQMVKQLRQHQQVEPTFEADSPVVDPRLETSCEYEELKNSVNEAANDLLLLINGPKTFLRTFLTTHYELAAFQVAIEFRFFENVPRQGSIHVAELAGIVGMDADRTGRFLRLLATQRVFREVKEDFFAHTAASMALAVDPEVNSAAGMQMDEMFKAAAETSNAIKANPQGAHSDDSPFKFRHGLHTFQFYAKHPQKAKRFAEAMAGVSQMDRQFSELRDGYDWAKFGKGKIVDIGGGSGHVSIYLAKQFPDLSFTVQDESPSMLAAGTPLLTDPSLRSRITYAQHNFFSPQPVRDASAYFIRQCIHNWPDSEAIRILRALVPALEICAAGTPLLINDTVLPKLGQRTRYEERLLRQLDVAMLVVINAKQRTEREFRDLVKEADARFEVRKVHSDGSMGLVEVVLNK